jgi:hypothetical protein
MSPERHCKPKALPLLSMLAAAAILAGAQPQSGNSLRAQAPQQSAPTQSEAQAKISVSADLVILPVTVKDRIGNLVPGLHRDEFQVFDDQVEQTIDVFTAEAFPLSLVVLVDDDLKSNDAEQMAASLRAVAAGISSSDEALVCRFDLEFYPGERVAGDADLLLADLEKAQDASGPSTAGPVPFVSDPSSHAPGVGEPAVWAGTKAGSRPTKALDERFIPRLNCCMTEGAAVARSSSWFLMGINGAPFNHHTYEDTLATLKTLPAAQLCGRFWRRFVLCGEEQRDGTTLLPDHGRGPARIDIGLRATRK